LDARLDSYYMGNSVGQPVEHAVALSHLILSGVYDRFPRLRVIAGHGGGYLPTHLGRADFAWQNRSDARGCERPPSDYIRQIWFDSLVYTPLALRHLVEAAGSSQVLLGTDYPFDMGVDDCVRRLGEAALDEATNDAIRGGNAALLNLLPAQQPPGAEKLRVSETGWTR
jgi:aminocarboxymuconate-semialdehyde decarboxylase